MLFPGGFNPRAVRQGEQQRMLTVFQIGNIHVREPLGGQRQGYLFPKENSDARKPAGVIPGAFP